MHRQHCHRDRDHLGHRPVLVHRNLHHRHPARRSLPDAVRHLGAVRRLGDLDHRHQPDGLAHLDGLGRLGDLGHLGVNLV